MRKFSVLLLVLFYFFISIKITANIHVCRGKVKSISIVGFSKQKSCCKKAVMDNNCCKDYKFSLKKSDSQENNISTILVPKLTFSLLPPVIFVDKLIWSIDLVTISKQSFHDPPPPEVFPKIYVKNCVYRI